MSTALASIPASPRVNLAWFRHTKLQEPIPFNSFQAGDCGIQISVYRTHCSVSGCVTVVYTDYPAKSYVCSHHTRDEQFVAIGRDLQDKKKWSDRRVHFQNYLLHAQFKGYATTPEFRGLVKPFSPPELIQVPEDLKLAAAAEYDRRIDESVTRITHIRAQYRPHENKQLLKRMVLNPLHKIQRLPVNKGLPISAPDKAIRKGVYVVDFPFRPTEEQELSWEGRLRNAYCRDHAEEYARAAKLVSECRKEINRDLKRVRDEIEVLSCSRVSNPGNSLEDAVTQDELLTELWSEQRELLEWRHQLIVGNPFRVPEPKVAEQEWIEEELQKLGIRRDHKYCGEPDDDDAEKENNGLLSDAPIPAGSPAVMPRRSRNAQAARADKFALWLYARPRSEQARILKLIDAIRRNEAGAVERFLIYPGIRDKLLPIITTLDYDVPTIDVAKAYGIPDGTLRKRIFELLQSIETAEVA